MLISEKTGRSEELERFWTRSNERVEAELRRRLAPRTGESDRLNRAMRHAVLNGGKRLRPTLTLAAYESLRGEKRDEAVITVGAAIEMLHSYSLIHDDLPCMDDDNQRRGQPTVHVAFDEATAVLAGDALHALAFELLAHHAPPPVVSEIARAVGPGGMVGGQMADMAAEGMDPTEEIVIGIHRRKTGALIAASARAGALLADADEDALARLDAYVRPLGLAFQIVDDILELTQPAEALGKPVGSDLKHKKVTYPAAVGLAAARTRARALADEAERALTAYPGEAGILLALAEFIVAREC